MPSRPAGTFGSAGAASNGSNNIPPPLPPPIGSAATPIAQKPQVAAVVNRAVTVILAGTGVPQAVQGIYVPDGCSVRVRAFNGTTAGNTHAIQVAGYPKAFVNLQGTPLAPLDDIAWPSTNLARIWVYGTAGDGVVISVISTANSNS